MKSIGESLAGCTAILELWPFRPSEWRRVPWRWERVLGLDDGPVRSVRAGMEQPIGRRWSRVSVAASSCMAERSCMGKPRFRLDSCGVESLIGA